MGMESVHAFWEQKSPGTARLYVLVKRKIREDKEWKNLLILSLTTCLC